MANKQLTEIEDIKNQKLICLDFDDCIIEYHTIHSNGHSRNSNELITLKLIRNVNKIKKFCDKHGYKVFITSSWSPIIDDNLNLKEEYVDELEDVHIEWWNIIKRLDIIGKDPFKDREVAMDVLLDNGNKIICIDDLDLEPHFEYAGENFIMINIINGKGWKKFKELDNKLGSKELKVDL